MTRSRRISLACLTAAVVLIGGNSALHAATSPRTATISPAARSSAARAELARLSAQLRQATSAEKTLAAQIAQAKASLANAQGTG